ncbi:MAG: N-6 DNA methylase [Cyanobacteria bacterium P01_F01_bin.150]
MTTSRMLELVHERLHWPNPNQIWNPSGAGPGVYAKSVQEKIGENIKRAFQDEFPDGSSNLKVGILAANPNGDDTEAPLAIVCQFNSVVSSLVIMEAHRLAWSFSRARSLITIEPHLLRVWSCCEPPKDFDTTSQSGQQSLFQGNPEQSTLEPVCQLTERDLSEQAADALQWIELVSGDFFQHHEQRFQRSGAADQMLLENLKEVRKQLRADGLEAETIHDLLARIIFIQFLFHKKDSNGEPAFNKRILQDLHQKNVLSRVYCDLPEILDDFDDTYGLFKWLNDKFNGDLFPGKGETEEEREAEWQQEIRTVRTADNRHLRKLAQFISGDLRMKDKQLCLWKFYAFDVIPLDFISSIYEEFVNKKASKGIHYTPEFIVDFMLDGVLPWDEPEWDLKILDPACGSGIFLVKAFQRLIHRWEVSHNNQRTPPDILRNLLENNIFGVDIDKEAVRVASFSLYLTMIDNIDPLKYWENEVRFPPLRNQQLIHSDFFEENKIGFRTAKDAGTYDFVIGNAPWGKGTATENANIWAKENGWEKSINYGNIGPLFIPKSIQLTKTTGSISMLQPAMTLLFNQSGPAKKFRIKILNEYKVDEIVNLSALRFGLFKNAVSPTCMISLRNLKPDGEPLAYICPKPALINSDNYNLFIDHYDVNFVYQDEAQIFPQIWAALMWGGRRDLTLVKKLSNCPNIASLANRNIIKYSQGIKIGSETSVKKKYEPLRNRYFLNKSDSLDDAFLYLEAKDLPINQNIYAERPRDKNPEAFHLPQLIVKQSWVTDKGRFIAALVDMQSNNQQGILCTESFVSIHVNKKDIDWLVAACLSYSSKISVYYLFLTSGRFASFIHEVKPTDLVKVPLAKVSSPDVSGINNFEDIDSRIFEAFSLKEVECSLIKDLTEYTLLDFKGDRSSPGRQKTHRIVTSSDNSDSEPELTQYCDYFFRVIKAGFGKHKDVCATIFQESGDSHLPVRLIAMHLGIAIHSGVKIEPIQSQSLLSKLNQLNTIFLSQNDARAGGIFYQRIARIYDSTQWKNQSIPTIYLIKPDKIRYWTRSMALRDADNVSAEIMAGHKYLTPNL